MAQKIITDLQLISAVTSGVSIPGHDGAQTYRLTAAQLKAYILGTGDITLAMLDTDILHGLAEVTPADDDFFPLADTSDSNLTKKGSVGSFRRAAYRSVTTTDAVTTSDEVMELSGASFTSTLPTAVGVAGKKYRYIHSGTNLSQKYTLATTSGQLIGAVASGSYVLCTNGEVLDLVSNGVGWLIKNHYTSKYWDAGTITVNTTSGSTSKGTIAKDKLYVTRQGKYATLDYRYGQTTAGTHTAGDTLISLPSNMLVDTTINPISTAALAFSEITKGMDASGYIGTSASGAMFVAWPYSTSQFRVILEAKYSQGFQLWSSAWFGFGSNPMHFWLRVRVPISDWQE